VQAFATNLVILMSLAVLGLPARAAEPPVSIELGARHGHATPCRQGCGRTGGGNIDVQQPAPDTLVVTMTGVAAAYPNPAHPSVAGFEFTLEQCFLVKFHDPGVKSARLVLEGRVIGLLRSHCKAGSAEQGPGVATVTCGPAEVLTLSVPPHSVAAGENLSVNCREGPVSVPVPAGAYTLHQTFKIMATAPRCALPRKAPSVEFAPDPALDPLWISAKEPFHGAAKRDFGFQVTLRLVADRAEAPDAAGKE